MSQVPLEHSLLFFAKKNGEYKKTVMIPGLTLDKLQVSLPC
jgi:hypothetical protein